jgi:hypothetical protein
MKLALFTPIRRALTLRRWLRMPLLLGAAVTLVLGLGAGTAFAYFTSSGHGSGTANTGTPLAVTVNEATGTVTTPLFPGSTGDLRVSLTNPNNYAVNVVGVTGNGTLTAPLATGCTTTGVTVNTQTGLSLSVPANASAFTVDIAGAVSMGASSDNGCQGATFQVPVSITVQKG